MNKNPQAPIGREKELDGRFDLLVHSIFPTIQGEGPFAGYPAVFIRMYGCNLQCPMCDTEYTSIKRQMSPNDIRNELVLLYPDYGFIVITGGEPFRQDIVPLLKLLLDAEFQVQVETNGFFRCPDIVELLDTYGGQLALIVSPKTFRINQAIAEYATAFKYVVSKGDVAEDKLPIRALGHPVPSGATIARPPRYYQGPIYVQPADEDDPIRNAANIDQAVQSVLANPTRRRLCLQIHKYANLP